MKDTNKKRKKKKTRIDDILKLVLWIRLRHRFIAVEIDRVREVVVAWGRTGWRDEASWEHGRERPRFEAVALHLLHLPLPPLGFSIQGVRPCVLDLEEMVMV